MNGKCLHDSRRYSRFIALAVAFTWLWWGEVSRAGPRDSRARVTSNASDVQNSVARGKYLAEGVAMCGDCHTPPGLSGVPHRSKWLMGASVTPKPPSPAPDWPTTAPRLAGTPPGTDAQMITLLSTGIWKTGKPLRPPMPQFHMTRADAQAVLDYLKSLTPAEPATSPSFRQANPQ